MKYECSRCRAVLAGGQTACGKCGLSFPQPVPMADPTGPALWPPAKPAADTQTLRHRATTNKLIVAFACCLLFFGGCSALVVRTIINANQIPYPDDPDRYRMTWYGAWLLMGPLEPGAPTFGKSNKADFDPYMEGWRFANPDRTGAEWVYLGNRNKSDIYWRDVKAVLRLYDRQGNYRGTTEIDFYDMPPHSVQIEEVQITDPNVHSFDLAGFEGQKNQ